MPRLGSCHIVLSARYKLNSTPHPSRPQLPCTFTIRAHLNSSHGSASNTNSLTVSNNANPTVYAKRICKTYMQNVYAKRIYFENPFFANLGTNQRANRRWSSTMKNQNPCPNHPSSPPNKLSPKPPQIQKGLRKRLRTVPAP
jgi:hypothetical protein